MSGFVTPQGVLTARNAERQMNALRQRSDDAGEQMHAP